MSKKQLKKQITELENRVDSAMEDYRRVASKYDTLSVKASKLSKCIIDHNISGIKTILIDDYHIDEEGTQHKTIRILTDDGNEYTVEMHTKLNASNIYYFD
jgi:hypothetical protein